MAIDDKFFDHEVNPNPAASFSLKVPRIQPVMASAELHCTASIILVNCRLLCIGYEDAF